MNRRRKNAASPRRLAFTVLEVMLVSGLMAFLAMLLSSAWSGIGRSAVDISARSQLLQELDLAVASLSRDLSGSLPIPSSKLSESGDYGEKAEGRWGSCKPKDPNGFDDRLELHYDKESAPGDPTKIQYYLEADPDERYETKILVRGDDRDGSTFTVARCVKDFGVRVSPDGKWISIELTFHKRLPVDPVLYPVPVCEHTRKCTLKARIPHSNE